MLRCRSVKSSTSKGGRVITLDYSYYVITLDYSCYLWHFFSFLNRWFLLPTPPRRIPERTESKLDAAAVNFPRLDETWAGPRVCKLCTIKYSSSITLLLLRPSFYVKTFVSPEWRAHDIIWHGQLLPAFGWIKSWLKSWLNSIKLCSLIGDCLVYQSNSRQSNATTRRNQLADGLLDRKSVV